MRRLFAGIALDDAARAACAAISERVGATGFSARYEEASKFHVTIAFLGNVADERVPELDRALAGAAAECFAFAFELDKIGAFPHERKPRIVYAGTRDAGAGFRTLAETVRDRYGEMGFTFPDDAVAHVTIARVKDAHRPLPLVDVFSQTVSVGEISLFESIFDPSAKTSRYAILNTYRLLR